jgi:trehalose 6-phosphate synthase/phosphatase
VGTNAQVRVRISPVGVHVARLREVMALPESKWRKGELEAQFAGKTLIVAVDDMDPFKGIDLKCQAMENLLRVHPELVGKVVLLQVSRDALRRATAYRASCNPFRLASVWRSVF